MPKFFVYIDSKVQGPVEVPALRKLAGFNLLTQVCAEGENAWHMADEIIEIKSYFLAPPRPSAQVMEVGNTALWVEPEPQPEALADPSPAEPIALSVVEPKTENASLSKTPSPSGLRISCGVCGYKNPRDVKDCMKCGTALNSAGDDKVELAPPKTDLSSLVKPVLEAAKGTEAAAESASAPVVIVTPTVEIPVARIAVITALLCAVTAAAIFGYRAWQKKHRKVRHRIVAAHVVTPATTNAPGTTLVPIKGARVSKAPAVRQTPAIAAATLPGVSHTQAAASPEPAGYRMVPQANALKRRESSPVDSPYAVKRRGDNKLWTQKEAAAIQLAQKQRVYGGLRTLSRNADILMQILRDREYMAGFESGKRPLLYNQIDWAATPQEGPTYEVQLTFSGGKEADGSVRKPLRFAFDVDLERGSVKPGGDDAVRANTMHAFFNEARIPPEERRAITKDVEQLVLAAQPGESPLTLDTVLRNFVMTYSNEAAGRVADAFNLDAIKKKLRHDPRLLGEIKSTPVDPAINDLIPAKPATEAKAASDPIVEQFLQPSTKASKKSAGKNSGAGEIDFQMDRAEGRGRTIQVRSPSRASPDRLWEIITGYDRLKQFAPDMLISEREGQDGSAIIVHTQTLARFMVFVFRINLHWRVIEHPAQKAIEFERIAGDMESFRGALQISTDPTTKLSVVQFRATVVPKGATTNWKMQEASRRFLVPLFDAIRTQAEAN